MSACKLVAMVIAHICLQCAAMFTVCVIVHQQLAEKNEDISRMDSGKLESYAFSDEEFLAELLKEHSYLSVVTEKAVETLDSAFAAATKLIGKAPAKPVAVQKPKVVILNSGWASHA
jgi:hypothetical protein